MLSIRRVPSGLVEARRLAIVRVGGCLGGGAGFIDFVRVFLRLRFPAELLVHLFVPVDYRVTRAFFIHRPVTGLGVTVARGAARFGLGSWEGFVVGDVVVADGTFRLPCTRKLPRVRSGCIGQHVRGVSGCGFSTFGACLVCSMLAHAGFFVTSLGILVAIPPPW